MPSAVTVHVDPSSLTDDPVELAAMEQAMARLIGMEWRPRLVLVHTHRSKRPQGDDRPAPKGMTLGQATAQAWG